MQKDLLVNFMSSERKNKGATQQAHSGKEQKTGIRYRLSVCGKQNVRNFPQRCI